MKVFLAIALLMRTLLLAVNVDAASVCTEGDLQSHDTDCNSYYQCRIGTYITRACPDGLHFNAKDNACDYPSSAGCQLEQVPANQQPGTTPPSPFSTTLLPSPTNPSQLTSNPQHPDRTQTEIPNCTDIVEGTMFQHQSCSQFWICSNGIAYELTCPANLHWSLAIKNCDYPEKVNCLKSTTVMNSDDQPTTTSPSPSPSPQSLINASEPTSIVAPTFLSTEAQTTEALTSPSTETSVSSQSQLSFTATSVSPKLLTEASLPTTTENLQSLSTEPILSTTTDDPSSSLKETPQPIPPPEPTSTKTPSEAHVTKYPIQSSTKDSIQSSTESLQPTTESQIDTTQLATGISSSPLTQSSVSPQLLTEATLSSSTAERQSLFTEVTPPQSTEPALSTMTEDSQSPSTNSISPTTQASKNVPSESQQMNTPETSVPLTQTVTPSTDETPPQSPDSSPTTLESQQLQAKDNVTSSTIALSSTSSSVEPTSIPTRAVPNETESSLASSTDASSPATTETLPESAEPATDVNFSTSTKAAPHTSTTTADIVQSSTTKDSLSSTESDLQTSTQLIPVATCSVANTLQRVQFLPHPDCARFYVCDWGVPIEMQCPLGTHFNIALNVCDYPYAAHCTPGVAPKQPTGDNS